MKIGKFNTDEKVFIIAELSANHSNSFKIAKDTIYAAKESGADAIKLQTYTPEWMTINSERDDFLIKKGLWKGKNLFELYKEAMTPLEWHEELFNYARELDLEVFSSPFSFEAVDFLEKFNPSAYKIASFELPWYDLIEYTAKKKKPLIISTGIATLQEIEDIVKIAKKYTDIALLKCTSAYPTPLKDANLKTIPIIKELFNVEVGFSDHTIGVTAPIVAVTLGAKIIEKHFILDKSLNSPDKEFSLLPKEFKQLVRSIREAEELIGEVKFLNKGREFARSIYVTEDIEENQEFTKENIKVIRPGFGLHPKYYKQIIGKKACKSLKKGDRLKWEDIKV